MQSRQVRLEKEVGLEEKNPQELPMWAWQNETAKELRKGLQDKGTKPEEAGTKFENLLFDSHGRARAMNLK